MNICIDCGKEAPRGERCLDCHGKFLALKAALENEADDLVELASKEPASAVAQRLGVSRQAIYKRRDTAKKRQRLLKNIRSEAAAGR